MTARKNLKEPVKYEQKRNGKGDLYWTVTQEWKEWDRGRQIRESIKTPTKKDKKRQLTPETHTFVWKEVASFSDTNRRLYFCTCLSVQGDPFRGCGAVGVQNSRSGEIQITKQPRFE